MSIGLPRQVMEVAVIDKEGVPVGVVISPEANDQLTEQQQRRERFWQTVDQIRDRNADKDPDEELAFITQVVEEVRQERYEREQREAQGDR